MLSGINSSAVFTKHVLKQQLKLRKVCTCTSGHDHNVVFPKVVGHNRLCSVSAHQLVSGILIWCKPCGVLVVGHNRLCSVSAHQLVSGIPIWCKPCDTVKELVMLSGINSSAVFTKHVLKQQLKLRKVCTRWVSHLLAGEQKQNTVDCVQQLKLGIIKVTRDKKIVSAIISCTSGHDHNVVFPKVVGHNRLCSVSAHQLVSGILIWCKPCGVLVVGSNN
jgi:hypothetical protein